MNSLQKTYYSCNIALIVLSIFLAGCAGRGGVSRPPQGQPPERTSRLPTVPGIQQPVIRIGLKTDARATVIESDKGIYVSDGGRTISAGSHITASPSYLATVATSFSVQVESFSTRENAEKGKSALSSRTRRRVFIYHNTDRNMEQLRVGSFSSREEAQVVVDEMKSLGYYRRLFCIR